MICTKHRSDFELESMSMKENCIVCNKDLTVTDFDKHIVSCRYWAVAQCDEAAKDPDKPIPNKGKVSTHLLDKTLKLDEERTKTEKIGNLQKENERLKEENVQMLQKLETSKGETQKKQEQCKKLEMEVDVYKNLYKHLCTKMRDARK